MLKFFMIFENKIEWMNEWMNEWIWDIISLFLSHILQSGDWTVLFILCFTWLVQVACSSVAHNMGYILIDK